MDIGGKGVEARTQSNIGGMADRGTCRKLLESEVIRAAAAIGLGSVALIFGGKISESEKGKLFFFLQFSAEFQWNVRFKRL